MLAFAELVATPLTIQLLGTPEISWPGGPLVLTRRRARALLFRLAASAVPVPRDQLAALFWPDVPDAAARRSLVVLLDHLRRGLPDPDLLVAAGGAVGLRQDLAWSDTVIAARALEDASREGRLDLLERAIALYRGPFLEGFTLPACGEFEAWVDQERETWQRRYLAALAALAEGRAARGDYRGAIEAARRALAIDELDEAAHRRLIALHAAADNRAAALRQYQACAEILGHELGVRPHVETRRAYETVRAGGVPSYEWLRAAARNAPARREAAAPHNPPSLPDPARPLIGRDAELALARSDLSGPGPRLLTFCGPGGSGKTSLAVRVADEVRAHFADGVVFVPLAPLRDPALLLTAICGACGLRANAIDPGAALRAFLLDKQILLVLDNCEHLADACARLVAELLAAAPQLRILATSRVLLRVRGEQSFPVPPLPVPDLTSLAAREGDLDAYAAEPALALLLARARESAPGFALTAANAPTLATICARLDGLPLAIELAAARLARLTPQALLARLDRRLTLLDGGSRGLPARHRTLGATIDWSYRLLGSRANRLFATLSVFAGGWSLDSAEAICADASEPAAWVLDGIQELLDAHLLVRLADLDGQPRFAMLETIREFARERLADRPPGVDDAAAITRRHAEHFLALARSLRPRLAGPDQEAALRRYDAEQDNLRAALGWAHEQGDGETSLALANALARYWDIRGYYAEGRSWLAAFLTADTARGPARGDALVHAARLARHQGAYAEAIHLATEGVAFGRERGDIAVMAAALNNLGLARYRQGDLPGATAALEETVALRRGLGDREALGSALNSLAEVLEDRGEYGRVAELYEEALAIKRDQGDARGVTLVLNNLADVARDLGDHDRALALAEEALARARRLDDRRYVANALRVLALVALDRGEHDRAITLGEESLALRRALGDRRGEASRLLLLAEIHRAQGDLQGAAARYAASLAPCRETGDALTLAGCLEGVAGLCAACDRPEQAARLLAATSTWREAAGAPLPPADRAALAETVARVRAALGPGTWATIHTEGAPLSLAAAGAEAAALAAELAHTAWHESSPLRPLPRQRL